MGIGRRAFIFLPIIHLAAILIYSGSIDQETDATAPRKVEEKKQESLSISSKEKDVTTPMTTVPITNPQITTTPMLNPTRSGSDSTTITTPNYTRGSSAGSRCVASQSASHAALQVPTNPNHQKVLVVTLNNTLTTAVGVGLCVGYGGADCTEIQPGGTCFDPISVRDHASYAFNSYYRNNPIPNSCNFGGSAVTTNIDPSYGTCQYLSTSTTSSVLNTTNSMGSHVFGARPITPPPPTAAALSKSFHYYHHYIIN